MKKSLLLLILNSQFLLVPFFSGILNSTAQSPNWLWAKGMGGTDNDYGRSIVTDASGNVYTTGSFIGTVDFDPGAGVFNLTGGGGFISKLDSSGNFIWAKAIGGSGKSIALDPAGSRALYTTGGFAGTFDFDPGVGTLNLTSAGAQDIFISKLDSSGNFAWAKRIGGTWWDLGNSISVDPDGSGAVYTTGSFSNTADFDPGAGVFNLTSAGDADIFISKLDSSGNFIWAKHFGDAGFDAGNSIAIDPSGSGAVYTTGTFSGMVDFDPGAGTFNLTTAGSNDIFISKLDSSGNFVWAKAMGATTDDDGYSIAIDPAGSGAVYTTGFFNGTVDFDPGAGVFNLTSVTGPDIFISKLDVSGNFVWAKAMGGTGLYDRGYYIAIDTGGSGDVYTTGSFGSGTADFDPGVGVFNLTVVGGFTDIFISKLDSSGNFVWAKSVGGINDEQGNSIAIGASGNVHVAGHFQSPSITFGSTTLTNSGYADIFIAKLDTMTTITGNYEIGNFGKDVLVFPNPLTNTTTISFSLTQSETVSLRIYDLNGRLVTALADKIFEAGKNEIIWDAADVNAGVYFLQFQSAEIIKTEKLLVTK